MNINAYWWNQRKNFGDQLTKWLLKWITGYNVIQSNQLPRLVTIGSVLSHARPFDVIWGSGLWRPKEKVTESLDIRAVRGPLTRQFILEKYPNAPEIYGDPAILLPLFYLPNINHFPGVTVISHWSDVWLNGGDRRISIADDVLTVIDAIASSEIIMTSSLHVLIVAECYDVPVGVVRNYRHIQYEPHFKFQDYYASTGRKDYTMFDVPLETAISKISNIPKPKFPDRQKLLGAFPFDKIEILKI
jgi:pyruvyltransferase